MLNLGVRSSFGLRRDDLIVKDGDMFAVEERMSAYERWRDERQKVLEAGRVPSLRVQTATTWAAETAQLGIDEVISQASGIEILEIPGAAGRPRGPRFGTLVHAVIATVPLDADEDRIRRTAETQGRIVLAEAAEVAAATSVVLAVLRHDLLVRARRASAVRRETPVAWVHDDGTLIEGVLDLAFDEEHLTTVVDFKTDHELAAGVSRYRAQLQQYVTAVAMATGRKTAGVLFRV